MIYLATLLLIFFSCKSSQLVIENSLIINELDCFLPVNVSQDLDLSNIIVNGSNLNFSGNIFFDKNIILSGIQNFNEQDEHYYLVLDNNKKLSTALLDFSVDKILNVKNIFPKDSTLGINENNNITLFTSPVNIFGETILSGPLVPNSGQVIKLDGTTCQCSGINVLGKDKTELISTDDGINLFFFSPSITINGNIEIKKNCFYRPSNNTVILPLKTFFQGIQEIEDTSKVLSINESNNFYYYTLDGSGTQNSFSSISSDSSLSIGQTNKNITINSCQILFDSQSPILYDFTTMSIKPTVGITIKYAIIKKLNSGSAIIEGKDLSINSLNNFNPSLSLKKKNFYANGLSFTYENNNHQHGMFFFQKPSSSTKSVHLVLDENGQLFYPVGSSKRFKENIKKLKISKDDFLKNIVFTYFTFKKNKTKYLGLNLDTLEKTIFDPILRFFDNQELLGFDEKELVALCATQTPHLEKEIKDLEEEILYLEKLCKKKF